MVNPVPPNSTMPFSESRVLDDDGSLSNWYYAKLQTMVVRTTTAQSGADAAQVTADLGVANAAIAQTTANTATVKANAAQVTADAAAAAAAAEASTRSAAISAEAAARTAADAVLTAATLPGQMNATQTNDSAAAGKLGEYLSSTVLIGSAVSLTTVTVSNITSLALTAGDWDVVGTVYFAGAGTTTVNYWGSGISTASATLQQTPGQFTFSTGDGVASYGFSGVVSQVNGPMRVSLSGTTTIYLVAVSSFAVSTNTAFGIIRARRVR